jgi:hypothetical protein
MTLEAFERSVFTKEVGVKNGENLVGYGDRGQ